MASLTTKNTTLTKDAAKAPKAEDGKLAKHEPIERAPNAEQTVANAGPTSPMPTPNADQG
jgi:hypothetical protein